MYQFPDLRDTTSSPEVIRLQDQHMLICRLRMTGMSRMNIARVLGCSYHTVVHTLNSSIARDYIAKLQELADVETINIAREIHEGAAEGAEFLRAVIAGHEPDAKTKERMDAALELLRMDGYTPVKKVQVDQNIGYIEKTGFEQITKRARLMQDRGVIDLVASEAEEPVEATNFEL